MMECIPVEIIEYILANPKLTLEDVLNFSATCSHFRELVRGSSYIWKKKFYVKWPQFIKLFSSDFKEWFAETRYIFELSSRTHAILSTMSPRFYKKDEFSDCDLEEWAVLIDESPRAYEYIVWDLITIINTSSPIKSVEVVPVDTPGNKTLQYYAIKVLRYIRQLRLSKEWEKFMALPEREQILEKGATLVAQWCQPSITIEWEDIAAQLDNLASEVRMYLKVTNADHPLHKVSSETLNRWKTESLEGNQWNVTECRQIIRCLTAVLYEQNKFRGNNTAYYMPENSFINDVLMKKQGLPITLAIIYESVARRVGLKCDPISFPAHFLLRFTEGKGESFADSYYIDVFNNGNVIRKGACPHSRTYVDNKDNCLVPATARQVVERMANNLEVSCRQHTHPNGSITRLRSTLELLHLISPQDISAVVSLARIYMLHSIDTKPLENYLLTREFEVPEQVQRVVHMLRDYDLYHKHNFCEPIMQAKPKGRPSNLTFAVGMVMKHLVLNYICVIYDWDPVCMASLEWQSQMGVHKLRRKDQQPFYNVLVEDGSHRYVAQENMEPTASTGFLYLNEDIGRHFSHFFETHYVPNAEKEKEFPADSRVRHMHYQKMQFGI